VNGTEVELLRKEKKVGSEAPAGRVKSLSGEESVIGMIAPTMQLLLTIPTIKCDSIVSQLKELNEYLNTMKKLKAYVITTSSEDIGAIASEYPNLNFVFDDNTSLAKSLGTLLKDGDYKFANALFVIDKEGIIKYLEIAEDIFKALSIDNLKSGIDKILADRKKGHSHENWMRA
jgi:thiol peroxidase